MLKPLDGPKGLVLFFLLFRNLSTVMINYISWAILILMQNLKLGQRRRPNKNGEIFLIWIPIRLFNMGTLYL